MDGNGTPNNRYQPYARNSSGCEAGYIDIIDIILDLDEEEFEY